MKIEDLIRDLADKDISIRIYAARALRWFDDEHAVRPLIGALKDENEGVRFQALKSLRTLTKQDFGTDLQAWERWFAQNK